MEGEFVNLEFIIVGDEDNVSKFANACASLPSVDEEADYVQVTLIKTRVFHEDISVKIVFYKNPLLGATPASFRHKLGAIFLANSFQEDPEKKSLEVWISTLAKTFSPTEVPCRLVSAFKKDGGTFDHAGVRTMSNPFESISSFLDELLPAAVMQYVAFNPAHIFYKDAPTVSFLSASTIRDTSLTLRVGPISGITTTRCVTYWPSTAGNANSMSKPVPLEFGGNVASIEIDGLARGTKYTFALVAQNSLHTASIAESFFTEGGGIETVRHELESQGAVLRQRETQVSELQASFSELSEKFALRQRDLEAHKDTISEQSSRLESLQGKLLAAQKEREKSNAAFEASLKEKDAEIKALATANEQLIKELKEKLSNAVAELEALKSEKKVERNNFPSSSPPKPFEDFAKFSEMVLKVLEGENNRVSLQHYLGVSSLSARVLKLESKLHSQRPFDSQFDIPSRSASEHSFVEIPRTEATNPVTPNWVFAMPKNEETADDTLDEELDRSDLTPSCSERSSPCASPLPTVPPQTPPPPPTQPAVIAKPSRGSDSIGAFLPKSEGPFSIGSKVKVVASTLVEGVPGVKSATVVDMLKKPPCGAVLLLDFANGQLTANYGIDGEKLKDKFSGVDLSQYTEKVKVPEGKKPENLLLFVPENKFGALQQAPPKENSSSSSSTISSVSTLTIPSPSPLMTPPSLNPIPRGMKLAIGTKVKINKAALLKTETPGVKPGTILDYLSDEGLYVVMLSTKDAALSKVVEFKGVVSEEMMKALDGKESSKFLVQVPDDCFKGDDETSTTSST